MKQPSTLPELLRHAADLAEKGESLQGKFEFEHFGDWILSESEEPNFYNYPYRIADKDQYLLDDGWIRHTGDVCPLHKWDEVVYMADGRKSYSSYPAESLCWLQEIGITHYKVIKEYVEPTTFEMKVGDKVFVLNKPYMSAPEDGARYWFISASGEIQDTLYTSAWDSRVLNYFNCWKTKADAKAYAEAKLARDKFEIGEIK